MASGVTRAPLGSSNRVSFETPRESPGKEVATRTPPRHDALLAAVEAADIHSNVKRHEGRVSTDEHADTLQVAVEAADYLSAVKAQEEGRPKAVDVVPVKLDDALDAADPEVEVPAAWRGPARFARFEDRPTAEQGVVAETPARPPVKPRQDLHADEDDRGARSLSSRWFGCLELCCA